MKREALINKSYSLTDETISVSLPAEPWSDNKFATQCGREETAPNPRVTMLRRKPAPPTPSELFISELRMMRENNSARP